MDSDMGTDTDMDKNLDMDTVNGHFNKKIEEKINIVN
jgi:hypothetical protein